MLLKRPALFACLTIALLGSLSACAGNPTGTALEQSLAPDPQHLGENPGSAPPEETPANTSEPENPEPSTVELPTNFPEQIPRYANAELISTSEGEQGQETRWRSSDPSNVIQSYYQTQFEEKNWEIVNTPTPEGEGSLVAKGDNLRVTVSLEPQETPETPTEFEIEYLSEGQEVVTAPSPEVSPTSEPSPTPTIPSELQELGKEIKEVPEGLRTYVSALSELGALKLSPPPSAETPEPTPLSEPNKAIARRELARWLVEVNNRMYANRPGKVIRLAAPTDEPAFKDVSNTDPDFAYIQGLAETGLIPSSLTGDAIAVNFEPDKPVTREQLILWKVPLDTRQPLPNASVEAVNQAWGFQDTAQIDSNALRAVLMDFNNGDFSNIRRVYGFTTLFQPKATVTRAEAAASLWYFGFQGDGVSAEELLKANTQP